MNRCPISPVWPASVVGQQSLTGSSKNIRIRLANTMRNQTLTSVNNNVGQTNWDGGSGGRGGSNNGGLSTRQALGTAAIGAVGGMAVVSLMRSATQSLAPTITVIETCPIWISGTTASHDVTLTSTRSVSNDD